MPFTEPVDTNPIVKEPAVFSDGSVTPSSTVETSIDVPSITGTTTYGISFNDSANELYAVGDDDNTLYVLDGLTNSVKNTLTLTQSMNAFEPNVMSYDDGFLYMKIGGASQDQIGKFDVSDGSLVSTLDLSGVISADIVGIAIKNSNLYVATEDASVTIYELDGFSTTVTDTIQTSTWITGSLRGITWFNDFLILYHQSSPSQLVILNGFTETLVKSPVDLSVTFGNDMTVSGSGNDAKLLAVANNGQYDTRIFQSADNGKNFIGNSGKILESGKIYSFSIIGPNVDGTPTINDDGQGQFTVVLPGGGTVPNGSLSGAVDLFFDGSNYIIQSLTEGLAQAIYDFQSAVKDNMTATTDPTVNDDSDDGYSVRSRWFNTVSGEAFLAVDVTVGAAIWVKASLTLDELGSAAVEDVGTAIGNVTQLEDVGGGVAGMPAVDGSQLTGLGTARIATGTYTGDGATSQGITGIGFQPSYVSIQEQVTADNTASPWAYTTPEIMDDNAEGGCVLIVSGGITFETNRIISLDADGFTVDDNGMDGFPNTNGITYNYLAIG